MNKRALKELGVIGLAMMKAVLLCGVTTIAGEYVRSKNKDQSNKFINSAIQAKNLTKNTLTKGYDIDDEYDLDF